MYMYVVDVYLCNYACVCMHDILSVYCISYWFMVWLTQFGNYISPSIQFDLVCDRAALVPLPASVYNVGVLIGAYAIGELADR